MWDVAMRTRQKHHHVTGKDVNREKQHAYYYLTGEIMSEHEYIEENVQK